MFRCSLPKRWKNDFFQNHNSKITKKENIFPFLVGSFPSFWIYILPYPKENLGSECCHHGIKYGKEYAVLLCMEEAA